MAGTTAKHSESEASGPAPETVILRKAGRAGRITLNKPKALNALDHDMALAIETALKDWATDDGVEIVVIDAEGEKPGASIRTFASSRRLAITNSLPRGRPSIVGNAKS